MRRSTAILFMFSIVSGLASPSEVGAQGFGGVGGFGGAGSTSGSVGADLGNTWHPATQLSLLPPENALNFITVDGTAELRVVPEQIRVVMAVTTEAETADECQEANVARVQAVVQSWKSLDIDDKDIVEDFINVLPRYEWRLTERDDQQVRVQQQSGFRMQTNLHISVRTEEDAMAAINLAFKQGVTEIVTFDYWSSQLNEQKTKARAAAIEAAQEKSKTLLAIFSEPPKAINIQESTAVFFPHSLYRTYENFLEEEIEYNSSWNNKPAIKAYRPKMTYFHGLQSRSDIRPASVAMRPEIAVVSSVRIYYQSPSDKMVPDTSN